MFWTVVNVLLAYAAMAAICVAQDCRRANQAAVKAVVDAAAETLCDIRARWEAAERRMTELFDRMEGRAPAPAPLPAPALDSHQVLETVPHTALSTDGWESDDGVPGLPCLSRSPTPSPTRGGDPLVR